MQPSAAAPMDAAPADHRPLDTFLSFLLWGTVTAVLLTPFPGWLLAATVVGSWLAFRLWMVAAIRAGVTVPIAAPVPVGPGEAVPDHVRKAWADAAPALAADGFVPAGHYRRTTAADGATVWSAMHHRAETATWASVQPLADGRGQPMPWRATRSLSTWMTDGRAVMLSDDATPAVAMPDGHWLWDAVIPALGARPSLSQAHARQVERYRAAHPSARPDPAIATPQAHAEAARRQFVAQMRDSGRWRVEEAGEGPVVLKLTWTGAAAATLLHVVPELKPAELVGAARQRRAARTLGVEGVRAAAPLAAAFGVAAALLGAAGVVLAAVTAPVISLWAGVGVVMARFHESRGVLRRASSPALAAGGALGMAMWLAAALLGTYLSVRGWETSLLPRPLLTTIPVGAVCIGGVLLARAGLAGIHRALR